MLAICDGISQRILSIEIKHEVKTIKVYEGETINYQLKGDNEWYIDEVKSIHVNDSFLLFKNTGIVSLRDLESIRVDQRFANGIGKMLISFGSVWLVYGTVAHFTSERNKWTIGTASIGFVALGVGYLTRKVAGKKIYTTNKNANFRLLDIGFTETDIR
jgi:hypothetical protein